MTLVVNVQVMKDTFWHCEVQKVAKSEPPTSTLLVVWVSSTFGMAQWWATNIFLLVKVCMNLDSF